MTTFFVNNPCKYLAIYTDFTGNQQCFVTSGHISASQTTCFIRSLFNNKIGKRNDRMLYSGAESAICSPNSMVLQQIADQDY
ncbi:MAG: hypothetical protein JSC189_000839 [Candidatus Tokpelaia sp. JSC189]|nr:MAG: hypothetical protein JSC189_000839 [Candidatus Tokpelaia sp. JSC189]